MIRPRIATTVHVFPDGSSTLKPEIESAISRGGGTVFHLQSTTAIENVQAIIRRERIAGILIPGGGDHPADFYGGDPKFCKDVIRERSNLERFATEIAITLDIPLLGICGGMQMLGIVFGGKLMEEIPAYLQTSIDHQKKNSLHEVKILPRTKLAAILKQDVMAVNSTHHQAVLGPGRGVISARSTDGIIEGIEIPDARFCLGVQWHPERLTDDRIIPAFLEACSKAQI